MSYQDFEDQEQESPDDGEKLTQRPSGFWIIFLIIGLIVAVIFYSGARIGGGGLKGVPGGFDAGSLAYSLAQQTETYRTSHPDRRNYCMVALFLEDAKGTIIAGPSQIFPGAGEVDTHCEQVSLRWVKFRALPNLQATNLHAVHIVLFSQVRVCPDCKPTFNDWQNDLQQAAPQHVSVHLYVFEIRNLSPSGFNPRIYPAGPSTQGPARPGTTKPVPVRPQDINQVR